MSHGCLVSGLGFGFLVVFLPNFTFLIVEPGEQLGVVAPQFGENGFCLGDVFLCEGAFRKAMVEGDSSWEDGKGVLKSFASFVR